MSKFPSTSKFPSNITDVEREDLESFYLDLRKNYTGLMISRGKYRSHSEKNRDAMTILEKRLRTIAEKEASVRADAYQMLEIVTNVIGDLEEAGDELTSEFESYNTGRKTYAGGSFLRRLIQAVIRFITRWKRSKEQLQILIDKQESMNKKLQEDDGSDS